MQTGCVDLAFCENGIPDKDTANTYQTSINIRQRYQWKHVLACANNTTIRQGDARRASITRNQAKASKDLQSAAWNLSNTQETILIAVHCMADSVQIVQQLSSKQVCISLIRSGKHAMLSNRLYKWSKATETAYRTVLWDTLGESQMTWNPGTSNGILPLGCFLYAWVVKTCCVSFISYTPTALSEAAVVAASSKASYTVEDWPGCRCIDALEETMSRNQ